MVNNVDGQKFQTENFLFGNTKWELPYSRGFIVFFTLSHKPPPHHTPIPHTHTQTYFHRVIPCACLFCVLLFSLGEHALTLELHLMASNLFIQF